MKSINRFTKITNKFEIRLTFFQLKISFLSSWFRSLPSVVADVMDATSATRKNANNMVKMATFLLLQQLYDKPDNYEEDYLEHP